MILRAYLLPNSLAQLGQSFSTTRSLAQRQRIVSQAQVSSLVVDALALANTPAYERSRHRRKKVETLFAHLRRILRLGRLRLRGPCGARDELLLAATA